MYRNWQGQTDADHAAVTQTLTETQPRPPARHGSVTGHHALRRARSVQADREQRARAWRRDYDA